MAEKSSEVNWKKDFCEKYFDKNSWELDVLNQVDILLKDKKGAPLLYIESKYMITNETSRRQALAQVVLTNKKQKAVLSHIALIYQDSEKNDVFELIDCSENSVMFNNDFNWKAEKPCMPTKDAIDRINDRITGRITRYVNNEIKEFYSVFKNGAATMIEITENNFNVVYSQWKNEVKFKEEINDEQDLINLFLVDMLNGTTYKTAVLPECPSKLEGLSRSDWGVCQERNKNSSDLKELRRELRKNATAAEARLWNILKGKQIEGLQFRRQFSVGNYILDFYCPKLKLAIELDGNYHNFVDEKDLERDKFLLNQFGIKTLRFENRIVFEQPDAILNSILNATHSTAASGTSPNLGEDSNTKHANLAGNFGHPSAYFDFREFMAQFDFSAEAKDLYRAALEIFRYYHRNPEYQHKDWNDSFYDITNAIMGKNPDDFGELETENDTRITKVKTTKGSKGFGRNTIKFAVSNEYLPVFLNFFDKRDILAQKINDELVAAGLLLWKRENIY